MFEKISDNHVRSSWGFEVKARLTRGRVEIEYAEGERRLKYDDRQNISDAAARFSIILSDRTFARWLPPHNSELIDAAKRKQITENIASALDFMSVTTNVLDGQGKIIGRFVKDGWVWDDARTEQA